MRRKLFMTPSLLILISLFLSACSGLIPLDDEAITSEFGPADSAKDRQMSTFDVMWQDIQDSYIYYDSTDMNWDNLHDEYTSRISSGLTQEEFVSLMHDLETEFPAGSFIYQSRAQRVESDIADSSTYDGIGAFIGFQEEEIPHVVILGVIEGSPAAEAGLKAHDSIFSIDGNPILLEEGLGAVSRIRGAAGSSVTLDVQSPGGAKRSVEVTRAKLTTTAKLNAYNVPDTDFGYIIFPPIGYQGLDQDVLSAIQMLSNERELKGLILDLRVANASQGWPLDTLFTLFHDGKIGELYNRVQTQPVEVKGQDIAGSQTMPLVILVGENTGGFAEVFAASLQAYKRAAVIGEQTTGDVETQSAFFLPDGSRFFIDSTSFRLSSGDEIGNTGITPDVPVEAGWDEILPNNDPVLGQAIETLENTK
jgi:carboxyl-terminal processing protease